MSRVENGAAGKLIIFGAWYICHAIAEAAEYAGWSVAGFVDPDPPDGVTPLGQVPEDVSVIAAVGDNDLRAYVCQQLLQRGRDLVSIIHKTVSISPSASVGAGCYLAENSVVRSNATLGAGVFMSAGAVVSHNCRIGDYAALGPNATAASHVSIGSGTLLGAGASVKPWTNIGRGCAVGAGSAVLRDIGDRKVAIGVPARSLPHKSNSGKQSDWKSNPIW